jgi:hypothetical protein
MRTITGGFLGYGAYILNANAFSGAFACGAERGRPPVMATNYDANTAVDAFFYNGFVVTVGHDNAPRTLAKRYWRRVA